MREPKDLLVDLLSEALLLCEDGTALLLREDFQLLREMRKEEKEKFICHSKFNGKVFRIKNMKISCGCSNSEGMGQEMLFSLVNPMGNSR